MNSENPMNSINNLSYNIDRLLEKLSKDFKSRVLNKARERGHPKIRQSHLSLLSNLGNGSIRLTELADRADISQQAMGKLVKEMENNGYIERQTDAIDKRAKIISPTESGAKLINDGAEIINEVLSEYTEAIGPDSIATLENNLSNATRALRLK